MDQRPATCEICSEALDEEERRSPFMSGGYTMCDSCFESDWSHRCGICDNLESNDVPIFAVVVGEADIELARETGVEPGIYQVLRWPWLSSDMFSQRVLDGSLLRVGNAPDHVDGGEFLCRECAVSAIVRRTRSGRWRVTTVRLEVLGSGQWSWSRWRSKTRIYRTRTLAMRRAHTYVHRASEVAS